MPIDADTGRAYNYIRELIRRSVRINRIAIKDQKIDYVVVREMCHLKHMDHSREFWNVVEAVLPDYEERRKWLKENGSRLY